MKITIKDLQQRLERIASKLITTSEAKYFASEQIKNHLKNNPRTYPLNEILGDLEVWRKNNKSKVKVVEDKGASLLLDFGGLSVSPKLKYIHDELEKRSKKYGIAMVGINNSHGIHDLNLWTDGLADRNLIGLCMFNGGPNSVIPFGGTKGVFGTNPISYALPTLGKAVSVDMATSNIPYFEIRNAKKNNQKLVEGSAVDSEGNLTTDPKKALSDEGVANLLPLGGGYKGYALVYLVEVLTGSLINSPLSTEMTPGYVNEEHGGIILAFDISTFTSMLKFKKSVSAMNDILRKQKPSKNVNKISIPGDRSYERLEKARRLGYLDISQELLTRLEELEK